MLALVSICKVFSSVFCNLCKINKKKIKTAKKKKKKKTSVSEFTSIDLVFKCGQNLGLIGTCQIKASAHQYHVTILQAQV